MTIKNVIKVAQKTVGWTQTTLAEACGYESQAAIGMALSRKNGMRVDVFVKMLNAMGYDVVVQSKNPNMNKNKWVLDLVEEGEKK